MRTLHDIIAESWYYEKGREVTMDEHDLIRRSVEIMNKRELGKVYELGWTEVAIGAFIASVVTAVTIWYLFS